MRSALAGYERALRSDRVRRGLGVPSLRRLFGSAGARAERLADARLGRGSAASGNARTGKLSVRAAGAPALTRVGSVGRVRVEATAAPGIGAGVDHIGYRVLSTSFVTHLHASQPAGTCAPFGGTSASQTFSGTSTGPVADGGSNTPWTRPATA